MPGGNGSQATLTLSTLAVGNYSIQAVYSGAANFAASASALLAQIVTLPATTTTLTSSVNPSTYRKDTITFTATVSATSLGVLTGAVTLYVDGVNFGSAGLSGGLIVANPTNQVTFTTPALGVGVHDVVAVYSGDLLFANSRRRC